MHKFRHFFSYCKIFQYIFVCPTSASFIIRYANNGL